MSSIIVNLPKLGLVLKMKFYDRIVLGVNFIFNYDSMGFGCFCMWVLELYQCRAPV